MFDFDLLPLGAFEPRPGGGMRLHGGKGNSAPAPDPRLVEAQVRSMGIQDDMIQRVVQQSDDMLPLQREQMQFGLDSARAAYDQSQDDRAWMLARRGLLSTAQDKLVSDAAAFNTDDRANELAGKAMADVSQGFANAEGQNARAMARMGVNPSDGKAAAMGNTTAIAKASALAKAGTSARDQARQEGYALTDRATNALAGYPAMGMQATGAGAGYGASGAAQATQGLAGMTSGLAAAGTMAGQMGQNATSMYSTQARDHYQQSGDSFGSILGGLGGLAAGAAKLGIFSDRRLKQDIVLVGVHSATGLQLYEFAYKDVPARRFRGVMADEVRQVAPDAVHTDDSGYDRVDYARLGIEMVEV